MNKEEEMALRELAAGRCAIQSVIDALGPMSLWSKNALEKEILKAVIAEREACAKVCEDFYQGLPPKLTVRGYLEDMAKVIRARGQA